MYISRSYKNISEIDFEDSADKKIVPIEIFAYKVIRGINGTSRYYNDLLIGAIDSVSHKFQIKCAEGYEEVFNFVSNKLRELGW